jgi:branched-chain amino acid transport system ATP-binding protein
LIIRNLEVRYGDLIGVADVSLDVPIGSVVALVGSNGAGITSTLNAIAGLVPPSGGVIEWRGQAITRQPAYAVVSKGLALSPEGWQLFVSQTVEQNLRLGTTSLKDRTRAAPGLPKYDWESLMSDFANPGDPVAHDEVIGWLKGELRPPK